MKIKVTKTTNPQDYEKIIPNFIYNRYDLFGDGKEFETVKIKNGRNTKVIEYRISNNIAELGLWLTPISSEELLHLLYYIKNRHPDVKTVKYNNGVIAFPKAITRNHFKIVFPQTAEEITGTMSTKSKYNIKRSIRLAEEEYGKMNIVEYDRSNLPDEIVEAYFKFKFETKNREYGMTPTEYLDRYHVSHCYVIFFGETIGAIYFSCEQCPVVYVENLTYNPQLRKYSAGKIIYIHHLCKMVEKKHTQLFLAGGNFEYKKHFGSIEETLYDCTINLSETDFSDLTYKRYIKKGKAFLKKHLPKKIAVFLWKVRYRLYALVGKK